MALSTGSTILVNDISTALDGKIDTAGTGLTKDGTSLALAIVTTSGGTAGPTANATPNFGATFTVPNVVYDEYGRVTGHTNYTVKIPAAPAGANPQAYVNAVWKSGNNWYKTWSNGFIEQGGVTSSVTDTVTLTFPKAFNTNGYFIQWVSTHNDNESYKSVVNSKTTTGCKIIEFMLKRTPAYWYACGF